jgi:type IV pilus assembly protein PilY1
MKPGTETMKIKYSLLTSLALLISVIGTAKADDTDIYMNSNATLPANSMPMVMFSLDYRPNLGSTACGQGQCDMLIKEGYMSATGPYTFFDVLRGALRKVFEPLEGIKVGLMLNHDNVTNCSGFGRTGCSNGGYIAMGFQEFMENDANGAKARFHSVLDNMPTPQGNQSHSYQGKELFFEMFRYLTGQGVYNAHNGYTDYGTSNKFNLDVEHPMASWDPSIESPPASKPKYDSPLQTAGACSKIYTVNAMFQVANQEADSDKAIENPISYGGFGSPQKEFADVVQYLNDADLANGKYGAVPDLDDKQNVTSYFLVDPRFINTTTIGYAKAGGTGLPLELSENPDELVATLQEIFKQILSVSTTFVAASVPVNVFNRAEITDNVYVALFQVDGDGKPTWVGNVKKLKLVGANASDGGGALVDATGYGAVAGDGRIRYDALTHWTSPEDLPPPVEDAGEIAGRDGRSVARGGAGQKIPGVISGSPQLANGLGGRTIYYDKTNNSLSEFNVDGTTASFLMSDFGASSVTEAGELIAFTRGIDIDDLDRDGKTNESRDWILGDALHSRPMPLNYGALGGYGPGNPAIYIAVASNDGMLRMIRNTTVGGAESGEEAWAFVPRRSLAAQKTLRDNVPGTRHPYTFDGAPVAYIADKNLNGSIESGDAVWLFTGMRRGGKAYYAMDVTTPEAPRLMWTIDDSGDFAELGYTFSNPRVGLVKTGSGPTPVIMFGGGYDMNKDSRGGVGSNDGEGNAIYVVNAETGQLIWKATGGSGAASTREFQHPDLVDSIPSALTAADTDGDGFTDRIVVGDSGGNVWRADLAGSDTGDWTLTRLASLGRHSAGASGKGDDRRFFHRPDLVQAKDGDGPFDAVLIGSGDRADPLDGGGTASNYFYMIKDRNVGVGTSVDAGIDHLMLDDVTSNCIKDGSCAPDLEFGWKLQMETSGEKILATPLTMSGKVFFTSYMPQGGGKASACSPSEGSGRLYAVSLQTADPVINYDTSDDMPSSDDPEGDDPTTKNDRSIDLNSAGIPAEVVTIPPNKILRPDLQIDTIDVATRWRTYWFVAEDSDL